MTSLILKQVILLWSLLLMVQMMKCSYPKCPRYCKCDVYMQLNRAECSYRRLMSTEVEIPIVVEILDLSYNDITTIETKSFQSYKDLVSLNLSHNTIFSLDFESFSLLQRIQEIDISHNRLQYLDDRTFERNRKLNKLNLEGNRFKAIAVKPFVKSPSLKQLNLRNCQITFINRRVFSQLPNLEELNLAENLLNNFLPQDFDGLVKLRILNLSKNPMRCDKSMQQKLQQLQDKGIQVSLAECKMSQKTPVMVGRKQPKKKVMPTQLQQPEDNDASMQWHYDFQWEIKNHQDEEDDFIEWLKFAPDSVLCGASKFDLCQNYRKCLANSNNALNENRSSSSYFWSTPIYNILLFVGCTIVSYIIKCTFVILVRKYKEKACHSKVQLTMDTEPLVISPEPLENPRQQLPVEDCKEPECDENLSTEEVGIENTFDNALDTEDACTWF